MENIDSVDSFSFFIWTVWTLWTPRYAVDRLANEWGARGPGFNSRRPDQQSLKVTKPRRLRICVDRCCD
jgi:hypothetical protein